MKAKNINKIVALAVALLSVGLYGCSSAADSAVEDKTTTTTTTTTTTAAVSIDSAEDKTVERDTTVSANLLGDGVHTELDAWDIEDEELKQKIFDWYDDFKAGKFEEVSKAEVDAGDRRAGPTPLNIYFFDEDNQPVKVIESLNSEADFIIDGEYYKFNDSSDNIIKAVYANREDSTEE